jgi:hypothetical protein
MLFDQQIVETPNAKGNLARSHSCSCDACVALDSRSTKTATQASELQIRI